MFSEHANVAEKLSLAFYRYRGAEEKKREKLLAIENLSCAVAAIEQERVKERKRM